MRSATTAAVILACAALVGLLAYGLTARGADATIEEALARGDRPAAPTKTLPKLDGNGTGSLADHRGKVVVLNFWASWCRPCRDEMPLLDRTHRKLARAGDGLVLGVDSKDVGEKARAFARKLKVTFPSLKDPGEYADAFHGTGFPETFIVDRDGRIAAARRFPVTQKWLDQELGRVLAG